jgi:hypothetical protein
VPSTSPDVLAVDPLVPLSMPEPEEGPADEPEEFELDELEVDVVSTMGDSLTDSPRDVR